MLWMILGRDRVSSGATRAAVRPAHLQRLQALQDEGRLILAGPLPINPDDPSAGVVGSLIVADFASREEAEAWVRLDPYWVDGVFETIDVQAFRQVLP